ncbi:S1C family serine protease [Blautia sp.]|nr:trypsin-like peptidase domain-containing protein [Blautia sp.]
MWNIATTVAFSALLFGVVEGGTSYAVEQYLIGQNNEAVTANETSSTTDTNVLSLSATTNSSTDQLSVTEIAASGLSSVVSVTNISVQEVENYFGGHGGNRSRQFSPSQTEETVSCGSGIILYEEDSQLYMLTNYHVVEGASSLSVTFVDDETYEAVLCGYDADIDLAVLKVDTSALSESTYSQIHVVEIGDSDALEVGEQVVAIGNALGYGQSVTTGIVSAVNRSISEDTQSSSLGYIQTDAAINPGNSGGALLDMEGKLVGINTAKIASTDVEGIGYAIPISQVLELTEALME